MGLCLDIGSLLQVGPLFLFPSIPQWLRIQQKRTCVPLLLNNQSRFMIWQIKGLSVSSPSIACKQDVESVDYYNVMNWTHVSVTVQCQSDGCSLSSKYGAIVWQSFGQLAAGSLTILEMAVDDRRCPHSLIHFGAICVNFIVWSLCFIMFLLWGQWQGLEVGSYLLSYLVQNAPNASLNPELWMLSGCRKLVFDAVPYTMQP